jgi:hypothetical protein
MVDQAAFVFVMAIALGCSEIVGCVDVVDEGFRARAVDLADHREYSFLFIHFSCFMYPYMQEYGKVKILF